ncbi:MAG: flippase-like domain-containing protein [Alphaproteobacteria bacterium]|nr:flippase-like domain-containing protein [Alphaproteobacteria bacterium]
MRLKIALVLLLTAGCLLWVLWGIEPDAALSNLKGVRWAMALPMVACFLVAHGLRCFRLNALLDARLGFLDLYSINAVGYLAINVVPFRLGEFVRPYLLLEQQDVPFGTSMAAIFAERLMDILALLTLLLGVTLLVDLPPQGVVVGDVDVVTAGQRLLGIIALGGAGFIAALLTLGEPVIRLVQRLLPEAPPTEALVRFLRAFHQGLSGLLRQPARAARVVAHTVGIWGLTILAIWCVLLAFDGVPHGLDAAATTWTITITGMTVAPTPGFFGAFEAFCVAALMLWEVPRALGGPFAVVMHLGQFGFAVALGVFFLFREGLSLREVVDASRAKAISSPPPPAA